MINARNLLLMGSIFALAFVVFLLNKNKPVESVQVYRDTIIQSIVATGRVTPAARIELASLVTANIKTIHAYEGDQVATGQILITLTDSTLEAALEQAKTSVNEAEQRVSELHSLTRPLAQHALEQAQSNFLLAKTDYQRHLALSKQNMLAKTTLDQAKHNLDINLAALESAQLQSHATQNTGSSSLLAQSKLEQARAALALAQAKINQLTLVSPCDGIIINRTAEVGATAQSGKTLLTLSNTAETRIELPIDEKSLRYLALNQEATVIADAYPNTPFKAHLSLIYPSVDAARATINVRFTVDAPPKFLRPDMTVSAEMQINRADHALILPTDAIHDQDSITPWVQVIRDGQAQQQPIQLGIRGVGSTQILSGVSEGDWIITQSGIKTGQAVTPQHRTPQIMRGFDLPNGLK